MRQRLRKKMVSRGRILPKGKMLLPKPALSPLRMLTFMLETRRWVGVSPMPDFFSRIYSRGEGKIRPFVFKRLGIPSGDVGLLSKAIGGMYAKPNNRALELLAAKYGSAKTKELLIRVSKDAEKQIRFARKAMADYHRISGVESISSARGDKQRLEHVIGDMFVQPLAAMVVMSKQLAQSVERQNRVRTSRQNL